MSYGSSSSSSSGSCANGGCPPSGRGRAFAVFFLLGGVLEAGGPSRGLFVRGSGAARGAVQRRCTVARAAQRFRSTKSLSIRRDDWDRTYSDEEKGKHNEYVKFATLRNKKMRDLEERMSTAVTINDKRKLRQQMNELKTSRPASEQPEEVQMPKRLPAPEVPALVTKPAGAPLEEGELPPARDWREVLAEGGERNKWVFNAADRKRQIGENQNEVHQFLIKTKNLRTILKWMSDSDMDSWDEIVLGQGWTTLANRNWHDRGAYKNGPEVKRVVTLLGRQMKKRDIATFRPKEVAMIVNSWGLLNFRDTDTIDSVLSAVSDAERLKHFEPNNVAEMVDGFRRLGFRDEAFLAAVCATVKRRMKKFKELPARQVVRGMADLEYTDESFLEAFYSHWQATHRLHKLSPQAIAEFIRLSPKLKFKHRGFLKAALLEIPFRLRDFTPHELLQICRALAQMKVKSRIFATHISRHVMYNIQDLRAERQKDGSTTLDGILECLRVLQSGVDKKPQAA